MEYLTGAEFPCSPARESSPRTDDGQSIRAIVSIVCLPPGRDYILISLPIAAGTGCLSVKCLRPSELNQKRRQTGEAEKLDLARRILFRAFSAERMRIQRIYAALRRLFTCRFPYGPRADLVRSAIVRWFNGVTLDTRPQVSNRLSLVCAFSTKKKRKKNGSYRRDIGRSTRPQQCSVILGINSRARRALGFGFELVRTQECK